MTTGTTALLAALVLVSIVGIWRWGRDGRIRAVRPVAASDAGVGTYETELGPALADLGLPVPADRRSVVQFTGPYCAICPQSRTLIERVLADHPGIPLVEVDASEHLSAAEVLGIRRTPTVFVLDDAGRPAHRGSGMPREDELRAALTLAERAR